MYNGLITVGVPVCNEGEYVRETLDSLVKNYDYIDRIIISDNCSDDDTGSICSEFADKYEKIEYVKVNRRVSVSSNWKISLDMANSKYFMWLAGHDIISDNYMSEAISLLEKDNGAMAFLPMVYHFFQEQMYRTIDLDVTRGILASKDIYARVHDVLALPATCYLCNQLCRLDALRQIMQELKKDYVNGDHILAMHMALMGNCVNSTKAAYYYRRNHNNGRPCTQAETEERYKKNSLYTVEIPKVNPKWYIAFEYQNLCRKYFHDFDALHLERHIIQACHLLFDVDAYDEIWKIRHEHTQMVFRLKSMGKRIVLFGTGADADYLYRGLKDSLEIECFIENNPEKWGSKFCDKPICSPNELKNNFGKMFVIVASSNFYSLICEQIESMGYKYWDDFVYWREINAWQNPKRIF